jgi:adenosine deaminase
VRSMEDSAVIGLARERGIPLEVCITSNYQSGVVPALSDHPVIRMLNAGLNVTLNTDDPSIEAITLGNEYRLICKDLGLPIEMLVDRILAAINAAFLPEAERQVLHTKLKKELGRGGRKSS